MRAGEQPAFERFFASYATRLAGFAARRSALDSAALEDVVQLTLISAVRSLGGFRGESSLYTWLCQICRNHLADARRKAARQPTIESLDTVLANRASSLPVQLHDYRDPLDECAADLLRSSIRRVLNALPARYARVLELRYGDDRPVSEVAQALQLTDAAAQSLLARARDAFRALWDTATPSPDANPRPASADAAQRAAEASTPRKGAGS